MSSDAIRLRCYLNGVNVNKIRLSCALCPDFEGVAREMRDHLHSFHDVGGENVSCPWCLGEYGWPNRKKALHWKHLKECFESYKNLYGSEEKKQQRRPGRKRRQPQPVPVKKAKGGAGSDFSATCVERGLYGRKKLSGLDERAYEHLFLPDLEGCKPEFRGNVRLAHQCVSMYQKKTYFWYHLMVRAAAFDLFCKVMENNCEKNSYFLLPFWCWCDGGSETNPYLRHHRHMILATTIPKFSTTIWQKIKMKKGTPNCKLAKPLQSVWHLVNTINYVSNLRSRCNFSFQKDDLDQTTEVRKMNHFHIATSLPKNFKLYIAGVMEKGFLNLLNESFGSLSVASFMEHAVREKNKQWRVQVKHLLPMKEIHEILPVTNVWKMTDKTSGEGFLHTLNNHKIFFDRDEDLKNVHFRQWVSMQIDCGNVFLDAIQEEFWTPTLSQQKVLNVVMPVFESNKKLHLKIEEKDSNLDKKDEEMRMLLSKFEEMAEEMKKLYSLLNQRDEEIRNLHSKLNQKEEENILLRSQLENLQNAEIERLKEENKYLREENKNSREELKKAYEEIKNLNTKVIAKLEDENKRILQILGEKSEEIKQLREENKRLKEELNYFRNREKINLVD